MQKIKGVLALLLVVTFIVTSLPLSALASGMGPTTVDTQGYTGSSSGLQYALSLEIELNEVEHSLGVEADAYSLNTEALGGILVVTLYENKNGIPQLIDLFIEEITSGTLENTPDRPEATGKLSFTDAASEDLMVSAVICSSLDALIPLSAAVSYDANGFDLAPVSMKTLSATEVTKTTAVLHGQVMVEEEVALNAADFGFVLGDSQLEEELAADEIKPDGTFTKTVNNLEEGETYYYSVISSKYKFSFGEILEFTTLTDMPAVSTDEALTVSSATPGLTGTARLWGHVEDDKGKDIIESGFYYGMTPDDLRDNAKNQNGIHTPIFADIGVYPGETRYYKAYAKTSAGTGYGEVKSYTAPCVAPIFATGNSATFDPVTWTVTFTGKLYSDGGDGDLSFGFRYKLTTSDNWDYVAVEDNDTHLVFSTQVQVANQIPPGIYDVEAYASNSVGTTQYDFGRMHIPDFPEVLASADYTFITESSAVLTGEIISFEQYKQRSFEYREMINDLWIEAGAEDGDFREGTFSFKLEELLPDTDYVFRAKATNNAGSVITSPEVTFTTRYVRETVYKMKEDGFNSSLIIDVLKDNYNLPIEEALSCMIFAGFSPDEAVSACRATNYPENDDYQKVGSALRSQEVALPAMIDILRTHYSSTFDGSNSEKNLKVALLEMEFNLYDVIKELLSTFEINMSDMSEKLGMSEEEELYQVLIRIYGVQGFAGLYWNDYVSGKDESITFYLKRLAIILHTYTELASEDIGIILQKVYPALNASDLLSSLRNDFTMEEIARALNSTLSADVFTIAEYLYLNYSNKAEVDSVLLDEWIHDAPTMVQVFWRFRSKYELPNLIASHLEDKFKIESPIEAAQLMYTTNIEQKNKYTKLQFTEIIGEAYQIDNAYDLIGVLKELGWSAEDIGNTMDNYSGISIPDGKTRMEVWFSEYKNQGFTSVDAGRWVKVSQYSESGYTQALLILKKYGYSLQEIAVMLKDVYTLSSQNAFDALDVNTNWTEEEITGTIGSLYSVDLIEVEINELKVEGKTATEIAKLIKDKYGKLNPYEIADYLIPLNYTMEEVLTALANNFTSLSELQFMQMLNNVLADKYGEQPQDYFEFNLDLFEKCIREFSHAKDCITLLHNLGFNLNDVTSVLQNRYEMTAFDAGQLLVNKNSYGVFYSPTEVVEVIKTIYNEDFVLLTMKDYKDKGYAPIQRLEEDFLINTPDAVARCLKAVGYTMAEVFEELDMYYFKASEHSFAYRLEGLTQIYKDVYHEEPFTTRQLLTLMGYAQDADPIILLPEAGFSRTQIVQILKDEYDLSVPEVINLYKDYFSLYTMASIENVWSKNEILKSIHDKIGQGDTLDDIHTLLQSYSESELESLNSYLKDAGFELDKMIEMMLNKQQHDYKAFYNVLQNVYDGVDVVLEYAKDLREERESATLCYHYVGSDFGLQDVKLLARGLKEAGYSDDEILIGIEENVRYQAISALRGLYEKETAYQLLGRMKLTYLTKMYRVEDLMNGILSEFPEIKYVEAIQAINQTKFYGVDTSRDIYVWLYSFGDSIPKDQKGDVAGILGSKNPEDLFLDRIDGSRALKAMGYNGVETTLWMRQDNYTDVEIFAAINAEFGSNLYYYRDTMNILHKAGFNIDELASTLISYEGKLYWGTMYALLGLKYSIPEVLNALIKLGADPADMIIYLQGYRRTRFRDKVEFPDAWSFIDSHYDYEESDLYLTYIASWVKDAVLLLPEEQRKDINIISETAEALYRINRRILVQETFDTMYHIASLECEDWNFKIPQADIILISEFIDLINSVISIGTGKTQDILTEVITVSALRSAGYSTDEMTYILKEKGEDWLMNIAKQALGGYNVEDAWHAVMDIPAYRVQFGVSVLWNIFTKSFDVATWIKIVKFVVEKHELLIKIGSMAIDAVSFSAPEPSIEPALLKGAFIQMMEEEIDLSGIKIFYGAEQIVTVGGPVTTGIGKSAVMAVKKPNAQGESQKDISLYDLSDEEILSMLDFFGSTEIFSEAEDGDNLRWRYRSQGTPGEYAIHICVEGGHRFQQEALFPPITGSVNITGRAKVGQTLSADISGIINASGALVYQWNRSGKPIAEAATSTYVLTKDDIGYGISVTVTANGVDAWGSITSEETERVTISSGTLIGNVINYDQIGLSGATVRLTLGEITYTTVTDAEGSYKFTNVPVGGGYAVTVSMEHYEVATRSELRVEEDKVTDAQTIYLSKTLYTIEIIPPTFLGSISCDPPKASVGTLITINIHPRDGYQLKAGSLKYNDGVEDHIVSGNTFTMPAANVTVTAEFEQIPPGSISGIVTDETGPIAQAFVIVTETANGKEYYVWTDDDGSYTIANLPHGAECSILVSKDGYYGGDATRIYITSGETTNVNIVLEKIPPESHSVIVKASPPEGGVVSGGGVYTSGSIAKVKAVPNDGYNFIEWSVIKPDGGSYRDPRQENDLIVEGNFTMTANFEKVQYWVSTLEPYGGGGKITASKDKAPSGEIIHLTIIPDKGMRLKEGSLECLCKTGEVVTINGTTFTMPATDVGISARFELIPVETYIVSVGTLTGGTISVSPTTATSGDAITLTITPDMGKQLKAGSLKYNDGVEDHIISGTSFIMPAANVTVTAEFENASTPVTDHDKVMMDIAALSIGYAPGDSAAAVTRDVSLTVTGAAYGSSITWTSSNASVISDSGFVTRPDFARGDAAVTVTATVINNSASSSKDFNLIVLKLPQITHTVSFNKNGGDTEASTATKEVIAGGNVGTLPTAPTRSGYTFKGWNTQANGSGTAFTAATAVNGPITVYAQWSKNSSGDDGGGGSPGGGGTSTPVEPPRIDTNVEGNTATATTTVTATVDSSGNAVAPVSQAQISDAISKAVEEAKKQGEGTVARVEIKVETPQDATVATTAEASLPGRAVNQAMEAGISSLTISTPIASISFDANTLLTLSKEVANDLKVSASKLEKASLMPETQRVVGDRPVFEFSVTSGDKTISQFGGEVSVSIPYTPKDGEDTDAIVIYYINASGELEVVSNCIYDPEMGMVSFNTRHFSKYAVGYNKVSFKDVASNAWYGKAVGFIAAREITKGTGGGNFSPEAKLTRGQFIVMLMSAYGIAPDTSSKDNFADAGNTYYTGYLASAKRLSISNGVGNNMFVPENEITRQEMFTLLYNALKVIGRLPEGTDGNSLSSFADAESIAYWAKEATALMVETGIISGNGGKLYPTNTTTRAEMAQVLYSLLSRY